MSLLAVTAYVIACGFTAAGLVAAAFRVAFGANPRFHARFDTFLAAGWSLLLCMFAGPFILVSAAISRWRRGRISAPVAAVATLTALVWSFCSGVVLVQLALLAGLLMAA